MIYINKGIDCYIIQIFLYSVITYTFSFLSEKVWPITYSLSRSYYRVCPSVVSQVMLVQRVNIIDRTYVYCPQVFFFKLLKTCFISNYDSKNSLKNTCGQYSLFSTLLTSMTCKGKKSEKAN